MWALAANAIPVYSLYALAFAHAGLRPGRISVLFAIWSATGLLAEVPTGVLADRFSRRGALVAAGLLQAAGFGIWLAYPHFPGFALGFVAWGLAGALESGAFQALVYDGLVALEAEGHYARLSGRLNACTLLAQLPAALAATGLYASGGYPLVIAASAASALLATALAILIPEPARPSRPVSQPGVAAALAGQLALLRQGLGELARKRPVRAIVLAVALVGGIGAIEEYFPLLARGWRIDTAAIPVAIVGLDLAGAAGAALGGWGRRLAPRSMGAVLGAGVAMLGAAAFFPVAGAWARLAALGLFGFLYQLVLVRVDARLQNRIPGATRATVTSVAALGTEASALLLFLAWALGGLGLIAILAALVALALPRWLRRQ